MSNFSLVVLVIIYQFVLLTSFLFLLNHSGIWLFHLQKDSSSIIYRSGFFFWSFLLNFILVFFIESTFFLKITISYGIFWGVFILPQSWFSGSKIWWPISECYQDTSAIFLAASCVFGYSLFLASLILRCTESTELDIPIDSCIFNRLTSSFLGPTSMHCLQELNFQFWWIVVFLLNGWIFKYFLSSNMMLKHYPFLCN